MGHKLKANAPINRLIYTFDAQQLFYLETIQLT